MEIISTKKELKKFIEDTDADMYIVNDEYICPADTCPTCGDIRLLSGKAGFSDGFMKKNTAEDIAAVVEEMEKEALSSEDTIICACKGEPADYDDYEDYMSDDHEDDDGYDDYEDDYDEDEEDFY